MALAGLGRLFKDGEIVVRQGEPGNCMFVIQSGQVEVVRSGGDDGFQVAVLGAGDSFGEMAIFEGGTRSATVRALGEARILTVDKRTFLRRVHEDPTLAFNMLRAMSERLRRENAELVECRRRLALLESERPAGAPE